MNHQEEESSKTQKYIVATPLWKRIKNIMNSSKEGNSLGEKIARKGIKICGRQGTSWQ